MNRHERRKARATKAPSRQITWVSRQGRQIPIWSTELDDLCDEDGNLVLSDGKSDHALVINGWWDTIRQTDETMERRARHALPADQLKGQPDAHEYIGSKHYASKGGQLFGPLEETRQ